MKKRVSMMLMFLILLVIGVGYKSIPVEARVTSEQKKEYVNALSQAIRDGVASRNMDIYADVSKGAVGKQCLKQAVLQNRAALMAEGIDFLDENWKQYYSVNSVNGKTVFNSTKNMSRKQYRLRYRNIMRGLNEVLACVEPSMTAADKAMAVYCYLTKETVYKNSKDCHTGYDVLVNHTGVCDGLANAYALALNSLGIDCVVVSNYTKDHSWNMVKLNNRWYLCDLTNGVGTGNHEGMVVSYSSCLVGINTFLKAHKGYVQNDIYGQGNSNGLNIRSLNLSSSDYMGNGTAIRVGIEEKTCMFYQNGYWYWISSGNMLKKSKLNGSGMTTVYDPPDDLYIGWIEKFNEKIYLSLNDGIYQMDMNGKNLVKVWTVSRSEYSPSVPSYFWQIAYVGRFFRTASGKIGYYVTDLHGVKKGLGTISLGKVSAEKKVPVFYSRQLSLQAGYSKQLFAINARDYDMKNLKWKSSNPKVCKVDQNGCVTAIKNGVATITAAGNSVKIQCKIKVTGYKISYKNVGINSSDNVASASGKKKIVLRNPKRQGYTFEGWYTEKNYRHRIKTIPKGNRKNYTLYARWKKK